MKRQESWLSRQHKGPLILVSFAAIAIIAATIFLLNKANESDRKIFQLNFIAILLGLVFEYRRLSGKWTTVFWTALGAYVFSFFAFARGKGQQAYIFEDRLQLWPYYFLGAFIIIAMIIQYTSATKKLTEGITLLLTIAVNYWIIENNYWSDASVFVKCLIGANAILSAFSIYNALSYSSLDKGARLILSIWSSIITLVLAIDNFVKLYQYRDIEQLSSFSESVLVFLEFVLLGISSIYFAQNLTMIAAYLPGKRFMDGVREMNETHLKRFCPQQVTVADSIIVTAICLAGFIANHFFQLLPVNLMIWALISFAPLLLYLIHQALMRK